MPTILSFLIFCLISLVFPVLFLAWLTESRSERICRLRARGMSQRSIAARLGVSRYQVVKAITS
jgi:hypothetical protein